MTTVSLPHRASLLLALGVAVAGLQAAAAACSPAVCRCSSGDATTTGWDQVPAILERIVAPVFPQRDFPITDFGAVPDGTTDATDAIRAAIAACHEAGGGRVVVPPGTFLTGAIHLRSRVNLHVSEGATLLFSTDPNAYLPAVLTRWEGMDCYNYSALIYAIDAEDIAITGGGTLDGQASAENWWIWKGQERRGWRPGLPNQEDGRNRLMADMRAGTPVESRRYGDGDYLRPNFIQPYRCRNVLIEGVTVLRSPMWEVHPVLCTNVTVRGVTIVSHGPNNDGCNPESCTDVLIEDSIFDTGDDCIAIKSGRNEDGRRAAVPSRNIIIRRCVMRDGHGGVVIGSEASAGVSNVFVEDCEMSSPNLQRALRLKTNSHRGGIIENVYMRRVRIGEVSQAVVLCDFFYEEGDGGGHDPVVRNIVVEEVTSGKARHALFLRGYDRSPISGVLIRNCRFEGVARASVISHVADLRMENVFLNTGARTDKWGVPID